MNITTTDIIMRMPMGIIRMAGDVTAVALRLSTRLEVSRTLTLKVSTWSRSKKVWKDFALAQLQWSK